MTPTVLPCTGIRLHPQVVQFSCNRDDLDPNKLPYKLNSILPPDIRVVRVNRTAPDFSVTCSALGKVGGAGARARARGVACGVRAVGRALQ